MAPDSVSKAIGQYACFVAEIDMFPKWQQLDASCI